MTSVAQRPLYVVVAGGSWDGVRFGAHSIAEQLLRHGRVLFVDPPISVQIALRDGGLRATRLRSLDDGFYRLTPVVPPARRRWGLRKLTSALVRRSLAAAATRLGGPVEAVMAFSPQFRVFGLCHERQRVYYAKDDVTSGAALMDLQAERLAAAELERATEADLVVAASEVIAQRWRERGIDPIVVPNGVDFEFCASGREAPRPDVIRLLSPIAGFVGHLSDRIDLDCLRAVAGTGTSLLIVGPRQRTFDQARIDTLLAAANVQWVGQQPYSALPGYLGAIDVGLVPYTDTAFNRASFPLKILQHLAAGQALVSTDLPAARWLATDLIDTESDPAAFAAAVVRRAATPATASEVEARQTLAAQHDWSRRVDDLLAALP